MSWNPPPPRPDPRPVVAALLGMGGMAVMAFCVLASGLFAPWWAVVLLATVWVVLFVAGTRWFTPHPWRVAALPVVMALVWFGSAVAGGAWLGWSA